MLLKTFNDDCDVFYDVCTGPRKIFGKYSMRMKFLVSIFFCVYPVTNVSAFTGNFGKHRSM